MIDEHGSRLREVRVSEDHVAELRETLGKVIRLIGLATLALESLIGLRVLFRLIAANPASPIAAFVYGMSDLFVWPFNSLTLTPSAEGFVLDLPAIIAMLIYGLASWMLTQLIWILFNRRRTRRITTLKRN
jgi:hypothetical protein